MERAFLNTGRFPSSEGPSLAQEKRLNYDFNKLLFIIIIIIIGSIQKKNKLPLNPDLITL